MPGPETTVQWMSDAPPGNGASVLSTPVLNSVMDSACRVVEMTKVARRVRCCAFTVSYFLIGFDFVCGLLCDLTGGASKCVTGKSDKRRASCKGLFTRIHPNIQKTKAKCARMRPSESEHILRSRQPPPARVDARPHPGLLPRGEGETFASFLEISCGGYGTSVAEQTGGVRR